METALSAGPPRLAAKLGAAARATTGEARCQTAGRRGHPDTRRRGSPPGLDVIEAPAYGGAEVGGSRFDCRPAGFLKGTLGNTLRERAVGGAGMQRPEGKKDRGFGGGDRVGMRL